MVAERGADMKEKQGNPGPGQRFMRLMRQADDPVGLGDGEFGTSKRKNQLIGRLPADDMIQPDSGRISIKA